MYGVHLNPFQIDEIELIDFDGDYNSQIGIQIHDKKWIREILKELREATYVKDSFPPDVGMGDRYVLLARKNSGSIVLHVEIYSGAVNQLTKNAKMITVNRFHYQLPDSIKQLINMTPSEMNERSRNVQRWIKWGQFVIINGEPYYANYVGEGWSKENLTPAFTTESYISSPTFLNIHEDETFLFSERGGTIPSGTQIYQKDGYYFFQGNNQRDSWYVLLPYGKSTHWFGVEQENKIQRWRGMQEDYFLIKNGGTDFKVFSAYDPATPEQCLLEWREEEEHFSSECSNIKYDLKGKPNKVSYASMKELPSFIWNDVLFITH